MNKLENVGKVSLYSIKIRVFDAKGTLRARDGMEELLKTTDELIFAKTGKHLNNLQQVILEGTLQGKKYWQIASEQNCTSNHIRDVASELWQQLSEILGENIKKGNYRVTLERVKVSKVSEYVQISNFNICEARSSSLRESTTNIDSKFTAKVATVIDNYHVAINRGSAHGIRWGQRVLIYKLSEEEIIDPDTGESLGILEIVKGTGKVVNIQENISTIKSDRFTIERKQTDRSSSLTEKIIVEEIPIIEPFNSPEKGDRVKLI